MFWGLINGFIPIIGLNPTLGMIFYKSYKLKNKENV